MRGLVLLLVVAVTVVIASPRSEHQTPEAKACHDLLDPFQNPKTAKATMKKCIAEQTGLQAIIDELKTATVTTHGPGHKDEGRHGDPISLLDTAGKRAELATLNQCIARENGHLLVAADGPASFDVTKFKGEVTAIVAGTNTQINAQLGLDNCRTKYLTTYHVHVYMECVEAYCATGEAPAPVSVNVTG